MRGRNKVGKRLKRKREAVLEEQKAQTRERVEETNKVQRKEDAKEGKKERRRERRRQEREDGAEAEGGGRVRAAAPPAPRPHGALSRFFKKSKPG